MVVPVSMAGQVAVVAGSEALVEALRAAGATVPAAAGVLASRSEADALFDPAIARIDLAVHAAVPDSALVKVPLVDLGEAEFDDVWEAIMRSTLHFLQAAFARMVDGGSVVIVVPSISATGAPGQAAWAAAAEAQRILALSAARQWSGTGMRVNCVAYQADSSARDVGQSIGLLARSILYGATIPVGVATPERVH